MHSDTEKYHNNNHYSFFADTMVNGGALALSSAMSCSS